MHRLACLLASIGLWPVDASAQTQLQSGWIGVSVPSNADLSYIDASGTAVPLTVTPNFGGTISPGTAESILHLPNDPDAFLVGGFGFVGRAEITAPGSVSYSLITNGIGIATQLSLDEADNVWVADAWTGQVRRIDAAGVVTPMSVGPQPWAGSLNAGVYDPGSGDFVAGGLDTLYRLPAGATVGVSWVTGLGGLVSGIAIDPCSGDVIATVLSPANRLVRVDRSGLVTDLLAPNTTITDPSGIAVDHNGSFVTGSTQGRVFAVDRLTGVPTLVATMGHAGTVTGVTVARRPIDGQACPFGVPCSSTYGTPWLRAAGQHRVGNPIRTRSIGHKPFTLGTAAIAFRRLDPPLNLDPLLGTVGCLQYLDPVTRVTLAADQFGDMAYSLSTNSAFVGATVYLQHVALDGVQLFEVTLSNALRVRL